MPENQQAEAEDETAIGSSQLPSTLFNLPMPWRIDGDDHHGQ